MLAICVLAVCALAVCALAVTTRAPDIRIGRAPSRMLRHRGHRHREACVARARGPAAGAFVRAASLAAAPSSPRVYQVLVGKTPAETAEIDAFERKRLDSKGS